MARIRTIKPEFFSHEILASKSPHARLLAIGLLTLADCEGRLRWVPMQVHSQVFPWEASVKIEVLLRELIDASYVVHYEIDGKRFVEVVNFRKHQRLSGKEAEYKSRFPPPPVNCINTNDFIEKTGEIKGKHLGASPGSNGNPLGTGEHRNIGTGEQGNMGTGEQGNIGTVLYTSQATERKGATQYTEDFERFWKAFPTRRRINKAAAFKAWKSAIKKRDPEFLLVRAIDYSESDQGNGEYCSAPASWLNSEKWEDDPEAWNNNQLFMTEAQKRIHNTRLVGKNFLNGAKSDDRFLQDS